MMKLTHYAYCGMSIPLGTGDFKDLRDKANRIAARRESQGFEVVRLTRNNWEIIPPDDCRMIPDTAGVMALERV